VSAPRFPQPGAPGFPAGILEDAAGDGGLDLRALSAALWTRRLRIGACAFAGAALALGLALVLPPVYVAGVSVLEAPRPGGGAALDQLGLSAEMLGIKAGGASSNALTYPDILRSRRLLEGVLGQSFRDGHGVSRRLIDFLRPGAASPQRSELAVRDLRKRLDISLDRRTNLLRLGVRDRDPVLAAAVANAACASLQDLVVNAMTTQAGANRRFVEARLVGAEHDLAQAEDATRAFRERNLHVDGSPRLALEQGRLLREMRTHEEVVIALTRQYEIARVDENRDVPVLNVLDPAVPPAFRASPRRGAMTACGLLFGLAVGLVAAWPRAARLDVVPARAEAA